MNVFIVYWHPEPKSFNGAMLRTAATTLERAQHTVVISDLQEIAFDPVSSRKNFITMSNQDYFKQQAEELYATEKNGFSVEIENEIEKIEWCDLMIWQFPLWWFGLPATLKGWVDRVFAMGRTYGGGKFYEQGVFKGKKALLSLTTGGPKEAYQRGGFNGDIGGILRPIQRGMLEFVGFAVYKPAIIYGPAHLSDIERQKQLDGFARRLEKIDREDTVNAGSYR
ncbi:MAG: NAD(P)H-dependent oxidoreductase [Desulfofustis sp.]|nr:NAD(P)H-dependent oxidoreductase [Desulfofustis sp.]